MKLGIVGIPLWQAVAEAVIVGIIVCQLTGCEFVVRYVSNGS